MPKETTVGRAALGVLVGAGLGVALYGWAHGGGSSSVGAPEAVLSCVQRAGYAAAIESLGTGTQQVSVTHGPGPITAKTTLQSSHTSIANLPSEDEAAFFVEQLQAGSAATGIAPELVSQRGNVLVIFGLTATDSDRAAIDGCLA